MKIVSENIDFRISTTGVEVKYTDDGESTLRLCAKKIGVENDVFVLEIDFQCVAELVCKTVNFYETNYGGYEIVSNNGRDLSNKSELSGFYRVIDSAKLESSKRTYDPTNALNLNHFLVTGGDSYFEIIAASYSIRRGS